MKSEIREIPKKIEAVVEETPYYVNETPVDPFAELLEEVESEYQPEIIARSSKPVKNIYLTEKRRKALGLPPLAKGKKKPIVTKAQHLKLYKMGLIDYPPI